MKLLTLLELSGDTDLVLAGDGSGMTHRSPCGWHVFALDVRTGKTWEAEGALSRGSSNLAEALPYLHALWVYQAEGGAPCRVKIVSDSELTVKCGRREYARRANLGAWAWYDQLEKEGFVFTFVHVGRNSTGPHKVSDGKSRELRKMMEARAEGL